MQWAQCISKLPYVNPSFLRLQYNELFTAQIFGKNCYKNSRATKNGNNLEVLEIKTISLFLMPALKL